MSGPASTVSDPLPDLDGALLRCSVLISRLRWGSYAGATYGALTALERVLTRYDADEAQR